MVVGDFEVDALLDAEGSFATYAEAFPEAGEADWAPWRDRHPELFDGNRWLLPFRSYLIRGRGRTILVDTGVGPAGEGDFLPERGHLPGHMSVRVDDELVILGDIAVHPAQLARPELVYVSDGDADRSARTREAVLTSYGDRILACGHFPGSGFGRLVDGLWTPLEVGG